MSVPYPADLYPGCPCWRCDHVTWPHPLLARMSLCPTCGDKRCPGATDHDRHEAVRP